MGIVQSIFLFLRAFILGRAAAAFENLALRQQVAVFKRSVKRPKLQTRDRIFWVWLSRLWPNWQSALAIVQPETVIKWQRMGFRLYWRWKSRAGKPGRPPIKREIRDLIRRMSRENPTWGAPRILSELLLLGHDAAEETVAKYMVRTRKPPSQTWRTFLGNHVPDIAACDFFTMPTVTFRVLYVFIILRHDRRQVVHFNITTNPCAEWTAIAGQGHLHSAGRRIASPILACCVIVNIGLPSWFAATGLRVTVERPDSPGFQASSWPSSRLSPNSTCGRSAGTIAG